MVQQDHVRTALKRVGMYNRYWGQPEIRELAEVLMPDELIIGAVNGRYEGGFAMLVATDRRLLLIDKKMMFLNLEDIRYDMIAKVDYSARLLDATTVVHTLNDVLRFRTMRQHGLRRLTGFMQQRVMELRTMEQRQPVEAPMVVYAAPVQSLQQPAASTPPAQTFGQRATPHPYVNAPLTVRRRVSRFYPLSD